MIRMVNQVSSVWFNDKSLRKSLHNETNFNKCEFTEKFCEFIKSRNVLVGATARVFVHYIINIVLNYAKCHLRMRGWIYRSNQILGASGLQQNWNESDNGCSKRPQLQRKAKPLARLCIIFCETLHLQSIVSLWWPSLLRSISKRRNSGGFRSSSEWGPFIQILREEMGPVSNIPDGVFVELYIPMKRQTKKDNHTV